MNNSEALIAEGRVWLFAEDNINTDLMMPQTVFAKSIVPDGSIRCARETS
jgi:3-isopropylmalate dehydratase small subunit